MKIKIDNEIDKTPIKLILNKKKKEILDGLVLNIKNYFLLFNIHFIKLTFCVLLLPYPD